MNIGNLKNLPPHHAILIVREDRVDMGAILWEELRSNSFANVFFNKTVLDIDTAREIISWANSPYNGEKTALISFHTASIPAQNAMLKILEEPKEKTRFILLTSNREKLLDTILSRVFSLEEKTKISNTAEADFFLRTPKSSRMKLLLINDLLSKEDEEKRKDRESVKSFVLSLVTVLSNKNEPPKFIKETLKIASYLSDPSTSLKSSIEYLSFLLPQIK